MNLLVAVALLALVSLLWQSGAHISLCARAGVRDLVRAPDEDLLEADRAGVPAGGREQRSGGAHAEGGCWPRYCLLHTRSTTIYSVPSHTPSLLHRATTLLVFLDREIFIILV